MSSPRDESTPRSPAPGTPADAPDACPACGGIATVIGSVDRPASGFVPSGLRFFSLVTRGIPIVGGPRLPGLMGTFGARAFQACADCGHLWARLDVRQLRDVLGRAGKPATRAVLARLRAGAKD